MLPTAKGHQCYQGFGRGFAGTSPDTAMSVIDERHGEATGAIGVRWLNRGYV